MVKAASQTEVVSARGIRIEFGAVKALDGADLTIHTGECVGLVGHNGAGKSTIVNVINGSLVPHAGQIYYHGHNEGKGISFARSHGVRCVFQELSLFPNLSIAENLRIMHSDLKGRNWRKRAIAIIEAKLAEIFPGHKINCHAIVEELSIAQRQMVEIAINFASVSDAPKLVILDEPTSSLDAGIAAQLMDYTGFFVRNGGAVLLISHMLGEIFAASSRIVVMKDGKVVADRPSEEFDTRSLVEAMGSVERQKAIRRVTTERQAADIVLSVKSGAGQGLPFQAFCGEVVGLAGLAGHGQTKMLLNLYRAKTSDWRQDKRSNIVFVAGDRSLNGTFALWSILKNLSITSLGQMASFSLVDNKQEKALGAEWKRKIQIRTPDVENGILSLSGGNQQKVLFARALATPAEIVLMDDPMRGVDVGTKQEVYDILHNEAKNGRTFIWYSTEMDEIQLCDRVYVFRDDMIVTELTGENITEQNVLAASFSGGNA